MDWLERNLDAYRLVADILTDLRGTLRHDLEAIHGDTWFRTGLPPGLLDRLIAAKEEEKSIDWYESEYQQVIDYAVFPDLLEILEHNAGHFRDLTGLAPSPALLHARFLELEVIRNKLGRTRPVSDGEVAFLKTFHARFRRAVDERSRTASERPRPSHTDAGPPSADEPEASADGSGARAPAEGVTAPEPAPDPAAAAPDDAPDRDDGEPRHPATAEPAAAPSDGERATPARAPTRPPQRLVRTTVDAATAPQPAADDTTADAGPRDGARRRPSIAEALDSNDSRSVLRELYREVTSIADGIWSSSAPPSTPMWDLVSTSTWYEHNFSTLQLRPLSDFYEVISKVERKMDEGAGRDELQRFLKDSNFAQVLLALRDMFQKAGL